MYLMTGATPLAEDTPKDDNKEGKEVAPTEDTPTEDTPTAPDGPLTVEATVETTQGMCVSVSVC